MVKDKKRVALCFSSPEDLQLLQEFEQWCKDNDKTKTQMFRELMVNTTATGSSEIPEFLK